MAAKQKSAHEIGVGHQIAKDRDIRGPRRKRAEVAKAEAFIDKAQEDAEVARKLGHEKDGEEFQPEQAPEPTTTPEAPKSTRKAKTYEFTTEELREAREGGSGRSWADVAKLLGLPNPGAARKAWADLTGTSHTEARTLVTRARKGATASSRLATPAWTDDTDRQTVVDSLTGARIVIKAGTYGGDGVEELSVAKVTRFDDTLPDRPAVVVVEGVLRFDAKTGVKFLDPKMSTGATRTIFLDRIVEVR